MKFPSLLNPLIHMPSPHLTNLLSGARVEPSFITSEDAKEVAACAKEIINKYGISHVSDEQRAFYSSQMKHLPIPKEQIASIVNMQRVTGRFESDDQKLAPWKVRREVLFKCISHKHRALRKA